MANQLPVSFDEFTDSRKKGFLRAKAVKDNGGKIAGTFCSYTPNEIFDAAGIHTVSLCGTSNETVAAAEADLPANLCPLIKSSYGFAVTDKCPYTYFSDIIVGETTCDGKKKMYELLGQMKDVYVLHLPQGNESESALRVWTDELRKLIAVLEEKFGVDITDEKLREAVRLRNRLRTAKLDLQELEKAVPAPAWGTDIFKVMDSANFSFDVGSSVKAIEDMTAKISDAYKDGQRPVPAGAKRILVTGCPVGGVLDKVIGTVERSGGVVVCLENCNGLKPARNNIDENADDIVEAIAKRYLKINCAVMTPNRGRMEDIRELSQEFHADGVIDVVLHACQPYAIESLSVKRLAREMNLPCLTVETDYSDLDRGQIRTRIEAFLEMI